MTVNKGVAPPEYDTPVGEVRANVGDIEYVPLTPPEVGFGDYEMFSDAEIEAFLTQAGGSVALATAYAYGRLVTAWNATSVTIRQDDMQFSNKDSVGTWLNMARFWREVAQDEVDLAGINYGDVVSVRGGCGCGYEYAPCLGDCAAPGFRC